MMTQRVQNVKVGYQSRSKVGNIRRYPILLNLNNECSTPE